MKFCDYTTSVQNVIKMLCSEINIMMENQKEKINDINLLLSKDKILYTLLKNKGYYKKITMDMFGVGENEIEEAEKNLKECKILLNELTNLKNDLLEETGYIENEKDELEFDVEFEATLDV